MIDPCSREVVGRATAGHLRAKSPEEALRMTLAHRRPPGGLLHHGDGGLRYASDAYRSSLAEHGIDPSMGRKGDRWDDAMVEGFSGTPRRGLVHHEGCAGHAHARRSSSDSVEMFHDRTRRHSTINDRIPAELEAGLT